MKFPVPLLPVKELCLIVDAAQGIQAQTISNLYLALEHGLEIIPILNKIDLPSAEPEMVKDQIVDLVGCRREDIIPASAKTGLGIDDILSAIIDRIPAPKGDPEAPSESTDFRFCFQFLSWNHCLLPGF